LEDKLKKSSAVTLRSCSWYLSYLKANQMLIFVWRSATTQPQWNYNILE